MASLRNIGIALSILGVAGTLGMVLQAASWEIHAATLILLAWACLPYIVLAISTLRIHKKSSSPASRIAIFVASLIVVILSLYIYYDAMFVSVTSTSALIFLFLPGYALVAIVVIYYVTKFLTGLLARSRKA